MSWKEATRGFTPPKLYEWGKGTYGELMATRVRRQDSQSVVHWSRVKDSRSNQICHVLANGPSLAHIDPEGLRGGVVISMNGFGLHPASGSIDVDYHCMAEPRVAGDSWESCTDLRTMGLLPHKARHLVVHPSHLQFVSPSDQNDPKLLIIGTQRTWTRVLRDRSLNLAKGIGPCQSTAILGIAIAMHLGCEEIHLYGMEHNFLCPAQPVGGFTPQYGHFYAETDAVWETKDNGLPEEPISYLDHIKLVTSVFEQHKNLAAMARRSGQRIINFTPHSFLDTYDQGQAP